MQLAHSGGGLTGSAAGMQGISAVYSYIYEVELPVS